MTPASSVRVAVGVATDRAGRSSNEDALHAADGVYVVADGMGGHESGELASRTAVDALRTLAEGSPDLAAARAVLRTAHQKVRALPARDKHRRPGTTASGVVLSEHEGVACWLVLNVGDSRTYRMAGGVLEQVTRDHSEVADLVERGVVARSDAAHHPRRHVVTRALGGRSAQVEPDVFWLPVSPGDRMLVCSDGLTDELTDARIEAELKAQPDPQVAADRLVAATLAAGGSDNVTVLVVDAEVEHGSRSNPTGVVRILAGD
ncbi:PP2C family serine/threonine-protein phosphatase [Cellulomonas sp. HZM]|uniref:PP2C family protein-serine/threonine phosphatase n=1 Tax=Cellulomonas sp. HZM TaxID=1454010 RepID=UPI00068FFC16|nr:protein phosphatase 2C domain-containing protein [Cellulomonas sp. HZM]